ncbi:peptidylprolyl isomerase [Tomitella gaofuii]|uniref:peptidylprolyl isomerase n=1 Tax=Tomitella gaofuii TaxID=2760083 RepID=UPI0015F960D4|nr:peptidylprolyl isomerase [Tomitella gaofuii]
MRTVPRRRARPRPRAVPAAPSVAAAVLTTAVLAAACSSGGPAAPDSAGAPEQADGISCSYPDSGSPARPVERPASLGVPDAGTLPVTLRTSAGEIGVTLDRASAPCAVHSLASLARQKFYVHTPCHRLTTPPAAVFLLQCGDPTGTGAGGPGYAVQDEPPAGLAPAPGATGKAVYPRGTVALSNHGVPDSGGSQFFLVYRDSPLPPTYSVLGSVDAASLPVLDAIAAAGTDGASSPGDGRPLKPVMLRSIVLPSG